MYISGDFGVVSDGNEMVIGKMPEKTAYRVTYTEGLPYYSGTTTFSQSINLSDKEVEVIEAFDFDFKNSRYDCIEVIVNGETLGVRAFTPYVFNVDKNILKVGENKVTLKVTNSLANMLDGTYFDYKTHKLVRIH